MNLGASASVCVFLLLCFYGFYLCVDLCVSASVCIFRTFSFALFKMLIYLFSSSFILPFSLLFLNAYLYSIDG